VTGSNHETFVDTVGRPAYGVVLQKEEPPCAQARGLFLFGASITRCRIPNSRLFYANLLSQSTFGGFNVAGGAVSMAPSGWSPFYKYKAGRVSIEDRGTYSGVFEADYLIEIHISSNGTFAGSRWRWSDTGGSVTVSNPTGWNVENITPVSGTWVTLNNGLDIRFIDVGGTPQFVLGDAWYARALRPYGILKALDGSRNTDYRSGTTPANSTIRIGWDLGSSQQPAFLAIDDHNIPSSAITTLNAHATTLFTEPGGFTQVVTWRANRIAELVTSGAFRYWWVKVVMPSSGQPAYLRFSQLFLGTGVTLAKQPLAGLADDESFLGSLDVTDTLTGGPGPQVYTAPKRQRTWNRVRQTASADGGKLDAAFTYATTHPSYQQQPFWFVMWDTDLSRVEFNNWVGNLQKRHIVADLWAYTVDWTGVIRKVAS
jgi:hypothetical protein